MQQDLPSRSEGVRRLVDGGLQQAAPNPNWNGFLRLSLVKCPVALVPATSDTEPPFKPADGTSEMTKEAPTIDIEEFVTRGEVDPRNIIRPYYIAPEGKVGHDPFAVIRETMRHTNRTAIARVTFADSGCLP